MNWKRLGDGFEYASPIRYNQEYRQVEMEKEKSDDEIDDEEIELSGKIYTINI